MHRRDITHSRLPRDDVIMPSFTIPPLPPRDDNKAAPSATFPPPCDDNDAMTRSRPRPLFLLPYLATMTMGSRQYGDDGDGAVMLHTISQWFSPRHPGHQQHLLVPHQTVIIYLNIIVLVLIIFSCFDRHTQSSVSNTRQLQCITLRQVWAPC